MKKEMKNVLSFIMIISIALLSFTACSSANEGTGGEKKPEGTMGVDENIEGALEGVELSVGTSGLFGPFSFYGEDGSTLKGYDLDLLNEMQKLLGFTIAGGRVEAMDYSALTTSVAKGKVDLALAALCATDERKEVMNFSNIYYDSGLIVSINKETGSKDITGIDSLKSGDYTVAVEKGTASHIYAQANIPSGFIEVHDTITTAYESLEQGKVDALIQDQPGVACYIKTKNGTKLKMVGEEFNQGQSPYAIAVSFDASKKYPGLMDIFNKALKELSENGKMDELKNKWFE